MINLDKKPERDEMTFNHARVLRVLIRNMLFIAMLGVVALVLSVCGVQVEAVFVCIKLCAHLFFFGVFISCIANLSIGRNKE